MGGVERVGFIDHDLVLATAAMMACFLPLEILDLIIDQLHDESTTLKACCLVSKSWVPRTRKHLFARVVFDTVEHPFTSWLKMFPDSSNSPARHTRSLSIHRLPAVTTTDAGVARCIRTFHNVVHLRFKHLISADYEALTLFNGFTHTVRSLRLTSTFFEVFDLICSFPLLEDLALVSLRSEGDTNRWIAPPKSPKLTGSLELSTTNGIRFAVRRLLDFPDGLRFTKITMSCFDSDFGPATDLVSRCSGTLESLIVYSPVTGYPLNLSKATKLRDLMFHCKISDIRWVIAALQTVDSKHLHQITIHTYAAALYSATDMHMPIAVYREWQDLDPVLVQFWTSHSIRPRLAYSGIGARYMRNRVPNLLPELTRRGLIDLVGTPLRTAMRW